MAFKLATLFILLAASGSSQAVACDAMGKIVNAFNSGAEAEALSIAKGDTPGCAADERTLIGRIAALTTFNRISTQVGSGGKLSDYAAELDALQKDFGGPWQVLDALGELSREGRDYASAARYYQSALEDADNRKLTPDWMAPDADYIQRLDRLASEMRLASPEPVKLAMRGGCKISFRGVSIKKKSTPVRYVFGTADFTDDGVESAKDLAECLRTVAPKSVRLIGHTDPIGSAESNRALSLARADALAQYLSEAGYKGHIATEGMGEDHPFKPDDASAYDEETLNQLNRRVEVDVEK